MITLCSSLLSGILATVVTLVVTNWQQRKETRRNYKMQIFKELIAYRTDIAENGTHTDNFQNAINQVFIAFNDSKEVIAQFENFRQRTLISVKTKNDSDAIINSLLSLLKAMANDLSIDYSFSNDDLFTRPIQIGRN